MDGIPESRSPVRSGEDSPKEPSIAPTHRQDVQDRLATLVDHGLGVMSYNSPSSVGPSGSVPGPTATLVQDSQPNQDSMWYSLPPPPPPAEPYESFLRRTGHSQLHSLDSSAGTTQDVVVAPSPSTTTAIRAFSPLPVPFPHYKGPSDGGHMQRTTAAAPGNRMLLPRHMYIPPPPAWLWPGQDAALTAVMNSTSTPTAPLQGPADPPRGLHSSVGMPSTAPVSTPASSTTGLTPYSGGTLAVAADILPCPMSAAMDVTPSTPVTVAGPVASSRGFHDSVGRLSTEFTSQVTSRSFQARMTPLPSGTSSFSTGSATCPISRRDQPADVPATPQQDLTGAQDDLGCLQPSHEIPLPSSTPGPLMFLPTTDTSGAQTLARQGNIGGPPTLVMPPRTEDPSPSADKFQDVQAFLASMRESFLQQVKGLPQPPVGPAVTDMGSVALRPLSPSVDRKASRARPKIGSKRAGGRSRTRNSSGGPPVERRDRRSPRRRRRTSASPSPQRWRSPPPKWLRAQSRSPQGRYSRSPADSWCGSDTGSHRAFSPSPASCHRRVSPPTPRWRQSRDHSPFPRGRSPPYSSRRISRGRSPSPRGRSPSLRSRRSPRGRSLSSRYSRTSPNRLRALSRSRSPPTRYHSSRRSPSRSPRSSSTDSERRRRRHSANQRLLLSGRPSRQSVQDKDTEQDKPLLDQQTAPSKENPPHLLEDFQKLLADNKPLSNGLETHGIFHNYKSFHRLCEDQDREARVSSYRDLMNLMLSQTYEAKQLINVTPSRTKSEGPFPSGLESEFKRTEEKLHLQWPPINTTQRVVDRTLGLYQHGRQPKAGSYSQPWPPPTVKNPWDKEFTPNDFPTAHKVPTPLPKRWKLHEESPIMLKPPTSSAVEQVPDNEIKKCSSWLEAFAARASHTSSISSTTLEAVYNFLLKVITFIRSSVAQGNIQDAAPIIDDLLQRVNSTVLEALLMSHDAAITATELYTHLHMLRRHSVLESAAVDLPQRDKDRLLVMTIGGNDLFGPNARKVEEWKKDPKVESALLIATAVHEQFKAQKKFASSRQNRRARKRSQQSRPFNRPKKRRGGGRGQRQ